MQVDLEKKVNIVDSFEMIVKLSENDLDVDSINGLKKYFDLAILTDVEDDDLKNLGKTSDLISGLISRIPKRIERLLEVNAPQFVIDKERSVLESMKKLNSNRL